MTLNGSFFCRFDFLLTCLLPLKESESNGIVVAGCMCKSVGAVSSMSKGQFPVDPKDI